MLAYVVDLAAKTRALPVGTVELVPDTGIHPGNPDYDLIAALIESEFVRVAGQATATPAP